MASTGSPVTTRHESKWGTVFGVVFFLIILSPFLRTSWHLLTESRGSRIPREKPDEELRVYHPYGFSIIAPKNWRTGIRVGDTEFDQHSVISMYPMTSRHSRHNARILLELMKFEPEDLTNYEATSFQGAVAYAASGTHPGYDWEWPPSFGYVMYFQRELDWYRLSYHIPQKLDSLPPEILSYFESFKTYSRDSIRLVE